MYGKEGVMMRSVYLLKFVKFKVTGRTGAENAGSRWLGFSTLMPMSLTFFLGTSRLPFRMRSEFSKTLSIGSFPEARIADETLLIALCG
jgi:hypothetical protein